MMCSEPRIEYVKARTACMLLLGVLFGSALLWAFGAQRRANADYEDQGHDQVAYPRDSWPSWSPDGKHISFVTDRSSSGRTVYEIDLRSGNIKTLTEVSPADEAEYSPRGTRLVVGSEARIWVKDLVSGKLTTLQRTADHDDVGFYPSFRSDSQILFMQTPRHSDVNCVVQVTLDQSLIPRISQTLLQAQSDLVRTATAPGGGYVAFTAVADNSLRNGRVEIHLWNTATRQDTLVFVSPHPVERMTWLPDCKRILVASSIGSPAVPPNYILRVADGTISALPGDAENDYSDVSVSRDGKWLSYASSSTEYFGTSIWRARFDGSDATELTHSPLWYREMFGARMDADELRRYGEQSRTPRRAEAK